jgi:hypothetical protein
MKRLSDFFYQYIKLWHALLLTGIMVSYASLVMGGKSECLEPFLKEGMSVLGLKFGYDYNYASSFFNALGIAGIECYRNLILIWDNIFPLLYGSMYIAWISLLYQKIDFKSPGLRLINLFPIVHILLDWTENGLELNLMGSYITGGVLDLTDVLITSTVSSVKWGFSMINYAIILTGIVIMITKSISIKKHSK